MPVRYYGIYLAFPPMLDMRHQGLGRYIASFLRGAAEAGDVHFIVVCPSWSRKRLAELLTLEGIPEAQVDVRAPVNEPLILRAYEFMLAYRLRQRRRSAFPAPGAWVQQATLHISDRLERRVARTYSLAGLIPLGLRAALVASVLILASPAIIVTGLIGWLALHFRRSLRWLVEPLFKLRRRMLSILGRPKDEPRLFRIHKHMEDGEAERLQQLIAGLPHVRAWYSPTAFWPHFNEIAAPKLMCVPDVLLADFPIGFSQVGDARFEETFSRVESAIENGEAFVTYSEAVKQRTLAERFGIDPAHVSVVRHAPHDLSPNVRFTGYADVEGASRDYCRSLLVGMMDKSSNPSYTAGFQNGAVDFLFYASQFRPNKNVITLLRAYEYLLRERYLGHKLILTGNPGEYTPVRDFIYERNLQNDVLCLHGLTVQELAACYKLAKLAVNPSLSEGGFPFTFSEALSVDTPVVMARIAVTEEIITDPGLQQDMLFNPYDWKDVAARIEWALGNRAALLARQKPLHKELARRTWTDVVREHVVILDRIADAHQRAAQHA